MLFDNFKPFEIPETGLISRETLKDKFPGFYNGQTVKINALEHLWVKSKMVNKDRMAIGMRTDPPKPTSHKTQANLIIDGRQVNLQYSDTMPAMNDKGIFNFQWPTAHILLKNGYQISKDRNQEDLLFFLYFGAAYIKNSYSPGRTPQYEFVNPEVKAAERIDKFKKSIAYESQILMQLSDEQVTHALKGLELKVNDNSDINRVTLLDKVKQGGDLLRKRYEELINSVNVKGEESDISDVVQKLIDDGTIRYEDGGWVQRSKLKADEYNKTPFYNKRSKDYDESRLNLIEHLKINTVLLDKLKS